MRVMKLVAVAVVGFSMVIGAASNAMAASATGTAEAEVLVPITYDIEGSDALLDFGTIVSGASGSITVSSSADNSSSSTGVTTVTPTVADRAVFAFNGAPSRSIATTLSPTGVTLNSGTDSMSATLAKTAPGNTGAGAFTIGVGGTLTVGASQAAGNYVSGPFSVTANYN